MAETPSQRVKWADAVQQQSQPAPEQSESQRTQGQRVRWSEVAASGNAQPSGVGGVLQQVRQTVGGAFDAFTGADSPIQAPEFQPATNRQATTLEDYVAATRTSTGFALTPDDQRRAEIIREQYPNAEFTTDILLAQERGIEWPSSRTPRMMARASPEQEWAFINAPGFSLQDVQDVGADVAAFLPAGKFQAGGSTLIGRMGRGAIAGAATQAARDEAAQIFGAQEGANAQRAVVTGGLQAASEPLVAVGGALARRFGREPSRQTVTQADAARLNRQQGMTPVAAAADNATAQGASIAGRSPEDAARRRLAGEFDVQLTQGQAARDPSQVREELLMARGATSGRDVVRPFLEGQIEAVEVAGRSFAGDAPADLGSTAGRQQAGERARDVIRGGAERLYEEIGDAYDVAKTLNASFDPEAVAGIPQAADDWLRANDVRYSNRLTPATMEARRALSDLAGDVGQDGLTPVSLERIDTTRRELLNLAETAQTNGDRRGARHAREALDSWLDRAIDDALISGDPRALDALKQARGLRARYARTYSQQRGRRRGGSAQADPGGALIERIVEDELTGTQVMNLLFGRSELGGKAGTARAVERLVTELGPESAEVSALREAYVARLLQRVPNPQNSIQFGDALAREWRDAIQGSGSEITNALFSREERVRMTRFVRLLEELAPPDGAGRTSGTAENVAAIIQREMGGLGRALNFGSDLVLQFRTGFDPARAQARQMVSQPVAPVSGALSNTSRALIGSTGGEANVQMERARDNERR